MEQFNSNNNCRNRMDDCRRFEEIRPIDYGPEPFVENISCMALKNENFRVSLWTGSCLQMTLMSIPVKGEIGVEMHSDTDQFLRVEEGSGMVYMGSCKERLNQRNNINKNTGIFVPAGTWHNIINTGRYPLKLTSIYAPIKHPRGTVHRTKEEADAAEY